jgi:hypothetical protein
MTRPTRPTVLAPLDPDRAGGKRRTAAAGPRAEPLEERRLLSASLSVSQSLMVFNAVNGSTSPTETLTLTDTGDAPLTLGPSAFAIGGSAPAQWSATNSASAPASLAAGASFVLDVRYTANLVGRETASLTITSGDPVNPVQAVSLSGIGTVGTYGDNQPSLARILRAYDIPTIVGEGPADANEATDAVYPNPPDPSSQEVTLQRLVKAGAGPVTIDVLASFTAAAAEPYTLGYYPVGSPQDQSQLFYTPSTESQSVYVQPNGSTSFDPGSEEFGLYFVSNILDSGKNRIGYSEDALNTWDTTNDRKFRFFPMETATGTVVPNSYVMATTEWDAPIGYDFVNIVAVISNVTAAPNAPASPVLTVTNPYYIPGSTTIMFSSIEHQNATLGDVQHDSNTLTLTNTGEQPLTITALTLSNTTSFNETESTPLPATLAAGGSMTVTINYFDASIPSSTYNETADPVQPQGGGFESATLTIASNDPVTSSRVLTLAAYEQYHSEYQEEPSLQTIVNLLAGYGTDIAPQGTSELTQSLATTGSSPTYYGEETISGYWQEADPSHPVGVVQLDAWHTQGGSDQLEYTAQGSTSGTSILNQASDDAQTLFPLNSSGNWATGSFTDANIFGFEELGGGNTEYSDDSLNSLQTAGGHHWRFFPVRDAAGNLVPNTYIGCMDYSSTEANYDFQDNAYIFTNIHPAVGAGYAYPSKETGVAPAAPTDTAASTTASGVTITWAPSLTTGVTGYNVYRETSSGTFTLLTSTPITTTSYLDATADTTSAYLYRVTAVNSTASQESLGTSAQSVALPAAEPATATITGTAFVDVNDDGTDDAGDTAQASATIYLTQGTTEYASVQANANGVYTLGGVVAGTYTLQETVPAGYTLSDPSAGSYTVTVTAGQTLSGENFGIAPDGTVTGTVYADANNDGTDDNGETGLAGVTVYLDVNGDGSDDAGDLSTTSGAGGTYTIADVPPGAYALRDVVPAGSTQTQPAGGSYPVTVAAGATVAGGAFGVAGTTATSSTATITGTVYDDTNSDGTQDGVEAGLAGETVYIDANDNNVDDPGEVSVGTDANGNYTFTGLAAGTYTIRVVVPENVIVTEPVTDGYTVTIPAGATTVAGGSFGLVASSGTVPVTTGTITGTAFVDANGDGTEDAGDSPRAGATIFLDANGDGLLDDGELSTVTAADGTYSFTDLPAGTYAVRQLVPLGDVATDPASDAAATATVAAGATDGGVDLGAEPLPASTLTAAVVTPLPKAAAIGGTTATVRVRITNGGATTFAGSVPIAVYLSADGTVTSQDTAAATANKSLKLKAGKSAVVAVKFTYPVGLTTGAYHIVTAVAGSATTAPAIASAAGTVSLTAATVDLSPTIVAGAKGVAVKPGKRASAAVRITNSGNTTAAGTVSVTLYATASGVVDSAAVVVGTLTGKKVKIAARRSTTVAVPFTAPASLAAGSYKLVAVVSSTTSPADDTLADDTSSAVATR